MRWGVCDWDGGCGCRGSIDIRESRQRGWRSWGLETRAREFASLHPLFNGQLLLWGEKKVAAWDRVHLSLTPRRGRVSGRSQVGWACRCVDLVADWPLSINSGSSPPGRSLCHRRDNRESFAKHLGRGCRAPVEVVVHHLGHDSALNGGVCVENEPFWAGGGRFVAPGRRRVIAHETAKPGDPTPSGRSKPTRRHGERRHC